MTLLKSLITHARATPDRPFLIFWEAGAFKIISYGDFLALCSSLAAHLDSATEGKHGVAFIILKHTPLLHAVFIACMMRGLIPSYLPFPTPKQDRSAYFKSHKALVDRTDPVTIITYTEMVESLSSIVPAGTTITNLDNYVHQASFDLSHVTFAENDVALLQHSSGTTGLKKGVALTYRQIARQSEAYANCIRLTSHSTVASWLPLYHDMGLLTSFLIPLTIGASVVSLDAFEWVKDPTLLLRVIETFRCTHTWLPNFAFKHIENAAGPADKFDLTSMVAFISCSEPSKPATVRSFAERFAECQAGFEKLQTCYAMAESVFAVTQHPLDVANRIVAFDKASIAAGLPKAVAPSSNTETTELVSNGFPIQGVSLAILRPGGMIDTDSHTTGIGEILVRGSFVFESYFNNTIDTVNAFIEGWYRTGDIGFLFDRELYICGRQKDIVIVHGRNYYSHDIEEIVSEIPDIIPGRVVAIGIQDEETASEEVIILAETKLAATGEREWNALKREVKRAVFDRMELVPRQVTFVAPGWLIKTTSGKISRVDNLLKLKASKDMRPSE